MFTTSTCDKCKKLGSFLEKVGAPYVKRVVDKDLEAETDAAMISVFSVPVLRCNGKVLKMKEIFNGEVINEGKVKNFIGVK